MILYFANRQMEIMGKAATHLRNGYVITEDLKTEDVESGVAVFECKVGYNVKTRKRLEEMTKAGNYILRQNDGSTEFYTIIDREVDTKNQDVYVYAEDAGLDLINEIAEPYAATEAHPASWYIEKWIIDSGFEIGINEIPASSARKLTWEGNATVTERLASIATQFGGYEISFSFAIKGMEISNKYVNIHKERGQSTSEQLRLDRDIDRIITKESVANLATALRCTGGMLEDGETYIDLKGYSYDDGDFYVASDGILRSRNAVAKWSRYVWNKEPNKLDNYAGHIIRSFEYDTLSQSTLCNHAITELKKICDVEINYEIDIKKLPENIKIGDRVDIVDDAGELYLSSRILKLETSVTENTQTATIGEHLIKEGGISLKVEEMAEKFAETVHSVAKAQAIADAAKTAADDAKTQADNALSESEKAKTAANEASAAASSATQSASAATAAAENAQAAVESVEKSVENIGKEVTNVQTIAGQAKETAESAQSKANEASQAAANALAEAADANAAVVIAQGNAESAISKAEAAQGVAATAKSEADTAKATAEAAKLDAQKANEDIESLGENLDTLSQTMEADYARKTELTEAKANLQTQITQNAGQISSTASKVVEIDETANNAAEQAALAKQTAEAAQTQANTAAADAEAAQTAANQASEAAQAAQNEANTAKAAATAAQSKADKAEEDLATAQAALEKVKSDVTATQEDIAAAEEAVANAQAAADKANEDATAAAQTAANAQSVANTASQNATAAQNTANAASQTASAAQAAADKAKADATSAVNTANAAKETATAAQTAANTAKTNAETAQSKADAAAQEAATAQAAADAADAKAQSAANDLATAKSNLAAVTSRVDATEADIEAAEKAVAAAQKAADDADAVAKAAQSTANTAKTNAANAQTAANNAKTAADNAQKAADDAQDAADAAQAAADALAVRVTTAETSITQNAEQIALRATKTEVANTLSGYYTKAQTDAALSVKANEITSSVSATYATKSTVNKTVKEVHRYYCSGGGSVILEETTVTSDEEGLIELPQVLNITNGKTYTVIWNGVSYTCVAAEFLDIDTVITLLGNYGALMGGESTGEPFVIMPYPEANVTLMMSGINSSFTVSIVEGTGATPSKPTTYPPASPWSETEPTSGGVCSTLCTVYVDGTFTYSDVSVNTAGTVAESAQNTAQNAATAASNAQADVDALEDNVSTNYATKSEVTQTANSITSSVSATYATKSALSTTDTKASNAATAAANAQSTANTAKTNAATAQNDVNELKTRITQTESSITSQASSISNHETRISTVEQTASGITVRLTTAESDIDTAQSTADAAKTAATNAQSTANTANSTASTAKTNAATAQSTADTAKKIANAGAKKINTHLRNFTKANWQTYGAVDHSESWTTGSSYDNTHINVGDIAYIVGKVSDAGGSNDVYATIYGKVTSVTTNAVVMTSQYYIMGGEGGAYALANTANSAANTANTNAANAAKTATNFLSYDSTNGLLIGNKSSGSWSGNRAQILPSSFNILNSSGKVLASYADSTIKLGANATSSVIELCGGSGTVEYGTASGVYNSSINVLQVVSDRVGLIGESSALMYANVAGEFGGYIDISENGINACYFNLGESTGYPMESEARMTSTEIYGLANSVHLVGRYGLSLDCVDDYIVANQRIDVAGGLMLRNGGQITGLTSSGTEITMLQMNANNYTMLGYGGYSNSIGATYVDGNVVNIRSKGNVNVTGNTSVTGNLTVSGVVKIAAGQTFCATNSAGTVRPLIWLSTSDSLNIGQLNNEPINVYIRCQGDHVDLLKATNTTYSAHFQPGTDGKVTLGVAAKRWYAVYATNGTVQTSDRREKENIMPLGLDHVMITDEGSKVVDLHSELFDRLQPVQYNFINGNKKTCYGLIAQDVIDSMHEIGIDENELDLVHHDFWTDEETGDTSETYGLGYTNLIAMLIHEVQKLKAEIATMKG